MIETSVRVEIQHSDLVHDGACPVNCQSQNIQVETKGLSKMNFEWLTTHTVIIVLTFKTEIPLKVLK